MESVQNAISQVVNDPQLFKEARYSIASQLPLDLGSLSLGYSNGEPKIYLTKMVGPQSEGCIDWDLKSFFNTWKNAIINNEFTPELTTLFQGVTNELMPGFSFDIGTFHWFLRPHCQDLKVGFALFGSRSFNSLTLNDPNSLKNYQFLSENIGSLIPASAFVFRRVNKNVEIGDISASAFVMVSSTSNIFLQICIKFVFTPDKLTKNIINIMSSNVSKQSIHNNFNHTNITSSETDSSDLRTNNSISNGNNNANGTINNANHAQNGDYNHTGEISTNEYNNEWKRKKSTNSSFLYSKSIWEWLTDKKFSLISISAAGLAINVANREISKHLRVKL